MAKTKSQMLAEELAQKRAKQHENKETNPLEALRAKQQKDKQKKNEIDQAAKDQTKVELIELSKIEGLIVNGKTMHNRSGVTTKEKEELKRFAHSLKAKEGTLYDTGLMQAITVRRSKIKKDHYELIAGFRRCEAFKINKETRIPAVIVNVDDKTARRLRNSENKQRRARNAYDRIYGELEEVQLYIDFNTLEEARAELKRAKNILDGKRKASSIELQKANNLADAVNEIVQKKIGTFVNNLEMLDLNDKVRDLLVDGEVNFSEALALKKIAKDDTKAIDQGVEYIKRKEEECERPSTKEFEKKLREITQSEKTNRGHKRTLFSKTKSLMSDLKESQLKKLPSEKQQTAQRLLEEVSEKLKQIKHLGDN